MSLKSAIEPILSSTQEICLLACAAYLLSRGSVFGRLLLYRATLLDKVKAFLFFAIVGTVEVLLPARASPNSSIIASTAAGLLMGPVTGLGVGAVGWLSELARGQGVINGGLGACLGALIAGWAFYFRPKPKEQVVVGFLAGALSHAVWFSISSLLPDVATIQLGSPLGEMLLLWANFLPLMLASGVGVLVFLWILSDLKAQQDKIASVQIGRAFAIANSTLPYLRHGLNAESASHIAEIVRSVADLEAVAISDGRRLLAHAGAGTDHHRAGDPVPPDPTSKALESGTNQVLNTREEIGCTNPNCPLSAGVVAPLTHDGRTIGCIYLYSAHGRPASSDVVELAVGIAQFLSRYQMELAELERQTQAASQAELKALQAQVHPHFLFNVLNTMAALCRIDPPAAGRLAVRLGDFLRRSLRESQPPLIPLSEEMQNVRTYLEIEKARFGDNLRVNEQIEPGTENLLVPSFGVQLLAENAVLHGISQKEGGGVLSIRACRRRGYLWLRVADSGVGMDSVRAAEVWQIPTKGRAGGLAVLRERCRRIYGESFSLKLVSRQGVGTTVVLKLPAKGEQSPTPKGSEEYEEPQTPGKPKIPPGVKVRSK